MPSTLDTQDIINVVTFGADPTGTKDSTAAIQAAINMSNDELHIQLGLGVSSGRSIFFPPGRYRISSLNMTHRTSLRLMCEPNTAFLYAAEQTTSAPIIDMSGSGFCSIEGLFIQGHVVGAGLPPAVLPSCAILLAGTTATPAHDNIFNHFQIDGFFAGPAICQFHCTYTTMRDATIRTKGEYAALSVARSNIHGLTSPYQTLHAGPGNSENNTFDACFFDSLPGDHPVVELENSDTVRFRNCATNDGNRHFHLIGDNQNLHVDAHKFVKFDNSDGTLPTHAFYAEDGIQSCVSLKNASFETYRGEDTFYGLSTTSGVLLGGSNHEWRDLHVEGVKPDYLLGSDVLHISNHRHLTLGGSATIPAQATRYLGVGQVSSTEAPTAIPMTKGHIIGASVKMDSAPSGGTRSFTIRKNLQNTSGTLTLASGTGKTQMFPPIPFDNGDLLDVVSSGTSTSVQNYMHVTLFVV